MAEKRRKKQEPIEETLNPLSGVFHIKRGATKLEILLDKFEFAACLTQDADNDVAAGLDVKVNGHHAGQLIFWPEKGEWYHLGQAEAGLFGIPVADPVGFSSDFAVALKNLIKDKWPDLFKEMTR